MCQENHKEKKKLNSDAKSKLLAYNWPGNVRELANIIERAIVLDNSSTIDAEHLLIEQTKPSLIPPKTPPEQPIQTEELPVGISLQELERRLIIETLKAQNNNRTKTAAILGISIRTLRNKLHEYEKQR
jgi:two-component system response regulator AtoC